MRNATDVVEYLRLQNKLLNEYIFSAMVVDNRLIIICPLYSLQINEEDIFKLSLTHSEHENTMSRPDTISSRFTAALNNTGGPNSNLTWNLFDPSKNTEILKIQNFRFFLIKVYLIVLNIQFFQDDVL